MKIAERIHEMINAKFIPINQTQNYDMIPLRWRFSVHVGHALIDCHYQDR